MIENNPYQSPQSDSTPEPAQPIGDIVWRNRPTWRFWILGFLVLPLLVIALLALRYVFDATPDAQIHLLFTLPFAIGIAIYVVAMLAIPLTWRGVSPSRNAQTVWKRRVFMFALTMLALLAAPSAFMTLCGPIVGTLHAITESATPTNYLAWVLGAIGGAFGAGIVILLARGLWLDAIGRPKKPDDDLPQRPIPRLRARRPTDSH